MRNFDLNPPDGRREFIGMPMNQRRRVHGSATPQPGPTGLDIDRLRASLRLIFDDATADRLAALALGSHEPDDALDQVARAAALRYAVHRWLHRLRLHRRANTVTDRRPLAPESGAPPQGAIALALHVGLDRDTDGLARAFDTTSEHLGAQLLRARHALRPSLATCADYRSLAGRYRDSALEINDRVSLLRHAQSCETCAAALDASRDLDDELLDRVEGGSETLAKRPLAVSWARRWLASPATLVAGVAIAVLSALILGSALRGRIFAAEHVPVPLAAAVEATETSGWLVATTNDGGVTAFNLHTGAQRTVIEPPSNVLRWQQSVLSPDRRRVATFIAEFDQSNSNAGYTLRVAAVDGTMSATWPRDDPIAVAWLSSWLDEDTVLIVTVPPGEQGLSDEENRTRQREASRLLAVDVMTGDERTLFQGNVSWAWPSPDGTLIAITQNYDPRRPAATLELRSLNPDGVGPVIASMDHANYGSTPVWAPDSSRVYIGRVAAPDPAEPTATPGGFVGSPPTPERVDLAALDRQGNVTTVVRAHENEWLAVLAVSPDGNQIVYQTMSPRRNALPVAWRVGRDGSNPVRLSREGYMVRGALWRAGSPGMILVEAGPFYLPGLHSLALDVDLSWITVSEVEPDGSRRGLRGLPALAVSDILSWLPEDAIPDTTATRHLRLDGEPDAIFPPEDVRDEYQIDYASSASGDGRYVLLRDRQLDVLAAWNRSDGTGRRLGGEVTDVSWVPGFDVLIGASAPLLNSRSQLQNGIALYDAEFSPSSGAMVLATHDPVEIRGRQGVRYARPLVSPDGLATSFFVVDDGSRTVALWVATWTGEAEPVASWSIESNRLDDIPLPAAWATPNTLVYASPDDWRDGFPERVQLRRLVIHADGSLSVETVRELTVRGGERGILLREMALSPDGERLAYRVRHFTRPSTTAGAFDTISVIEVEDASESLEIARASPGDGLSWSPDSNRLAVGLRHRVALIAADGRSLEYLVPDGVRASWPIWVGQNEIWYSDVTADPPVIIQVKVR